MPPGPLSDGTVTLRAWRPDDADWYAEQSRDAEIQRFTTESPDLEAQTGREPVIFHCPRCKQVVDLDSTECAACGSRLRPS